MKNIKLSLLVSMRFGLIFLLIMVLMSCGGGNSPSDTPDPPESLTIKDIPERISIFE